jgi:hypothetical protein
LPILYLKGGYYQLIFHSLWHIFLPFIYYILIYLIKT